MQASEESLRDLVHEGAWLQRMATTLTQDPALAADAAQATWIEVWKRQTHSPGELIPRAWMLSVLRNAVRSLFRQEERRRRRESAAATPEGEGQPSDESLARIELQRTVLDAIESLKEPYRSTIVRRFLDGLSIGEIAEDEGLPRKTVETRSLRGVQQLRAVLAQRKDRSGVPCLALLTALATKQPLRAVAASAVQTTLAGTAIWVVVGLALVVAGSLLMLNREFEQRTKSIEVRGPTVTVGRASAPQTQPPAQEAAPRSPLALDPPAVRRSFEPAIASPMTVRTVDVDGLPLRGVPLGLFRTAQDAEPWAGPWVSDVEGRIQITLPTSPGDVPMWLDLAAPDPEQPRIGLMRVRLDRSMAAESGALSFPVIAATSGTLSVVDEEGAPVAGANVQCTVDLETYKTFSRGDRGESIRQWRAVTDQDGKVQLSDWPVHRRVTRLVVSAPGYIELRSAFRLDTQKLTLRRRSEQAVQGYVMDAEGSCIASAWVVADGGVAVKTDEQGRFAIAHAQPGALLTAVAEGLEPQSVRLGAETPQIQLSRPTATLSARLDGLPGNAGTLFAVLRNPTDFGSARIPVSGTSADIRVCAEALARGETAACLPPCPVAADTGTFQISGLFHRPYDLLIVSPAEAAIVMETTVTPGMGTVSLPWPAERATARLSGTATTKTGQAIAGARIEVFPAGLDASAEIGRRGSTGKDGSFEFTGLRGDSWQLRASRPNDPTSRITRIIERSETLSRIELILPESRRARFEIVDPSYHSSRLRLLDASGHVVPISFQLGGTRVTGETLRPVGARSGALTFPSTAVYAELTSHEFTLRIPIPRKGANATKELETLYLR
ncbi:MAG: sigma-70 family RNA polymerase sigma factor [Planctomycetota bacterium]